MIFFSDRKKLEKKYKEWLKIEKAAKDCTYNVITFLASNDLFDEEKVKEFIK